MKGIILAGGSGTRLYPTTQIVCKQLLPIYDKPMIYYPLSTLMQAGIRDVLIISTPQDIPHFVNLFKDGSHLGMNISYEVQLAPKGIPEAFTIGESFIGSDNVCLILGDNIFYGNSFPNILRACVNRVNNKVVDGGTVFCYYVADARQYGVAEIEDYKVISLEEKPEHPKSNWAVTGLYLYTNDVIEVSRSLQPSARGETEITAVNQVYLEEDRLTAEYLGRGFSWIDTGSPSALVEASSFIKIIEERKGMKIGCIEEIAFTEGFITEAQYVEIIEPIKNSPYGKYLLKVLDFI